jgi:hypothetical protein
MMPPPIPARPRSGSRSAREATGGARGRDGEVITRIRRGDGQGWYTGEFDIPTHLLNPNFVPRGVRTSCLGKPDPENYNKAYQQGFRPCRAKDYPGLFLDKHGDDILERDGIMLMEQPIQLAQEALDEERMAAQELREVQTEAFGSRKLPKGFKRGYLGRNRDGSSMDARKSVVRDDPEPTPRSMRPSYEYAGPGDDE